MKVWTAVAWIAGVAALSAGCNATTRHNILSVFFDGVPPLPEAVPEAPEAALPAHGPEARRVGYREHGPYAARLCNACHESGASNALVLPKDQLCFKCHDLKLDKKYIHGPLASGGCLACHDPHSSQYRYFLLSDADTFCVHCHNPDDLAKAAAHQGVTTQCTECHDAHMSNKRYLLK